ncbi:MAG: zinc metalloprotease HtpX [Candidatus Aenigmatarchaeota archaeon]
MLNTIKTFTLLSVLTGLFLGVGYLFGGMGGAFIALVFAGLLNFISYWHSDKIILKMYNAKEVKENDNLKLHRIVSRLSERADIPKPRIYMLDTDNPNAFATGRNPENSAVAVTKGIIKHLDKDEIEGVLSHEISHIKNRDTLISTVSATVAGAVTWIAQIMAYSMLFGGRDRNNVGGGIFMIFFAPLAASLIRMAISRNREFMADESGAKISKKPESLKSALKKIHSVAKKRPLDVNPSTSHIFIANPLNRNTVANLFSTHPPLEERLKRLSEVNV